ncbi:hypothetical protein VJ923_07105 [Adlercreutzia sp. R25]|uniref:hypothetical protein n=1 Tax=Adlercreutzia shanghongiae TaxID=3111773 RepID=UPI002DB9DAFF|nr:hypothetical protein [Adlercreutzia sp. R25]MEC4272922.1 hypothetical protein [Adlercreutzia sp. R25]
MIKVPASVLKAAQLFTAASGPMARVSVRGGESFFDVCATDRFCVFRAFNAGLSKGGEEMTVDVSDLAKKLRAGDGTVELSDVGGGYVRADVVDGRRRFMRLVGEMLKSTDAKFPNARDLVPPDAAPAVGLALADPKHVLRACRAAEALKSAGVEVGFLPRDKGEAPLLFDLAPGKEGLCALALVAPKVRR